MQPKSTRNYKDEDLDNQLNVSGGWIELDPPRHPYASPPRSREFITADHPEDFEEYDNIPIDNRKHQTMALEDLSAHSDGTIQFDSTGDDNDIPSSGTFHTEVGGDNDYNIPLIRESKKILNNSIFTPDIIMESTNSFYGKRLGRESVTARRRRYGRESDFPDLICPRCSKDFTGHELPFLEHLQDEEGMSSSEAEYILDSAYENWTAEESFRGRRARRRANEYTDDQGIYYDPKIYGLNERGYDKDGYNQSGFNEEGKDRDGYDTWGKDDQRWDRDGRDSNGRDDLGLDRDGNAEESFRRRRATEASDSEIYEYLSSQYGTNRLTPEQADKAATWFSMDYVELTEIWDEMRRGDMTPDEIGYDLESGTESFRGRRRAIEKGYHVPGASNEEIYSYLQRNATTQGSLANPVADPEVIDAAIDMFGKSESEILDILNSRGRESYRRRRRYGREIIDEDGNGYGDDGYDFYDNDIDGYDRDGYDHNGLNRRGRDYDGYDEDGRNEDGYDRDGYDEDGYDEHDRDSGGFDSYGLDSNGVSEDEHKYGPSSEEAYRRKQRALEARYRLHQANRRRY